MLPKLIQKFSGEIVHSMVLSSPQVQTFKQTYSVIVIHTNCELSAADDSSLPRNSYLVKCDKDGDLWYDIVMGLKPDIFDAYYDTFGNVIKDICWTNGKIHPKLWGNKKKKSKD